jgi:hypothetical protein
MRQSAEKRHLKRFNIPLFGQEQRKKNGGSAPAFDLWKKG